MSQISNILNAPLLEIIKNNDSYRNYTTINKENLFTLTEVNTVKVNYNFQYPTLIHRGGPDPLSRIYMSQEEFSSILFDKYPFMVELFSSVKGIVLAGGAIEWVFSKKTSLPKDFDFFLYSDLNNINTTTTSTLNKSQACQDFQWEQLITAVNVVFKYYKKYNISQTFTKGLLTLEINSYPKKIQIQFILRDYNSHSQILHGFDLSSCACSFDGTTTHFTPLGAWSYHNKLNIVWPAYRSPSYEHRLIKYWNKGFGLVFPHMAQFTLGMMDLSYLMLNIIYCSGNFAYGNIFLEDNKKQSDYSNDQIQFKSIHELHELNTLQIIQNSNIYKVSGRYYPGHPSTESTINFKTLRSCVNITQLVPIVKFKQIIEQILYKSIHIKNRKIFIDFYILQNIFKFDHNQIIKFIELATEYNKLLIDNPFQKYNLNYNKFQPKITEFIEKYEISANTEINWWIPFNQNIPFTGALNPIMEEPADWYGKVPITSIDNRIPALNSNSNNYNHNNDILCSCCFVPIMHNDLNIIKLQCGHIFHYLEDIEHSCIGVKKWINAHNECPNCRCKIYFQNEIFDLNI